jgi:hypothetical protein
MDHQNNYGSVTITYTYNNQMYTDTGSFTINDPYNFIATINDDTNFSSNCLTPGVSLEVLLDKTTNKISSVSLNFNNRYLYSPIPSSVPISNVTIDGNVILNNTPIPFNYNMKFQTIVQAYIFYSFTSVPEPEPVPVPIPNYFSPAALNQVATTRYQASALLTTLAPGITNEQINQIANDAGLIVGHGFSIVERLQNISDILKKK